MHHANASMLERMQPIQANVSDVLLSESNENLNTSFQLTELNGTGLNIVTNASDDGIPIMDFSHDPAKLAMDAAIKWFSICIMVEVMLGLGCAVDLEVLKVHIKRPIGVGIAGVCQFIIMPLVVFGLARALRLHKVAAVVMLVTASVPGGTLSNILAYLIDGDLALSMLMTSCSSILAFAFIPLNLFIYGSQWMPEGTDYSTIIPYTSVILSLVLMMMPVFLGVLINWRFPKVAPKIILVCKILLCITILCLAVLSGLLYRDSLLRLMPNELWLICVFMPMIGFGLGFLLSFAARQNPQTRRTVAIETGCQNGQLGCAILKVAFPNHLIGSFFVFPLLYSVFQLVEGLLLVAVYKYFSSGEEGNLETEKPVISPVRPDAFERFRKISLHTIDKVRERLSRSSRSDDKRPVVGGTERGRPSRLGGDLMSTGSVISPGSSAIMSSAPVSPDDLKLQSGQSIPEKPVTAGTTETELTKSDDEVFSSDTLAGGKTNPAFLN